MFFRNILYIFAKITFLKKIIIMKLEVNKDDIKLIGRTSFNEDGNTAIVCKGSTCNLEKILLRNILKCFGDEYSIIKEEDYGDIGNDEFDVLFVTNLPFETYLSL